MAQAFELRLVLKTFSAAPVTAGTSAGAIPGVGLRLTAIDVRTYEEIALPDLFIAQDLALQLAQALRATASKAPRSPTGH